MHFAKIPISLDLDESSCDDNTDVKHIFTMKSQNRKGELKSEDFIYVKERTSEASSEERKGTRKTIDSSRIKNNSGRKTFVNTQQPTRKVETSSEERNSPRKNIDSSRSKNNSGRKTFVNIQQPTRKVETLSEERI